MTTIQLSFRSRSVISSIWMALDGSLGLSKTQAVIHPLLPLPLMKTMMIEMSKKERTTTQRVPIEFMIKLLSAPHSKLIWERVRRSISMRLREKSNRAPSLWTRPLIFLYFKSNSKMLKSAWHLPQARWPKMNWKSLKQSDRRNCRKRKWLKKILRNSRLKTKPIC